MSTSIGPGQVESIHASNFSFMALRDVDQPGPMKRKIIARDGVPLSLSLPVAATGIPSDLRDISADGPGWQVNMSQALEEPGTFPVDAWGWPEARKQALLYSLAPQTYCQQGIEIFSLDTGDGHPAYEKTSNDQPYVNLDPGDDMSTLPDVTQTEIRRIQRSFGGLGPDSSDPSVGEGFQTNYSDSAAYWYLTYASPQPAGYSILAGASKSFNFLLPEGYRSFFGGAVIYTFEVEATDGNLYRFTATYNRAIPHSYFSGTLGHRIYSSEGNIKFDTNEGSTKGMIVGADGLVIAFSLKVEKILSDSSETLIDVTSESMSDLPEEDYNFVYSSFILPFLYGSVAGDDRVHTSQIYGTFLNSAGFSEHNGTYDMMWDVDFSMLSFSSSLFTEEGKSDPGSWIYKCLEFSSGPYDQMSTLKDAAVDIMVDSSRVWISDLLQQDNRGHSRVFVYDYTLTNCTPIASYGLGEAIRIFPERADLAHAVLVKNDADAYESMDEDMKLVLRDARNRTSSLYTVGSSLQTTDSITADPLSISRLKLAVTSRLADSADIDWDAIKEYSIAPKGVLDHQFNGTDVSSSAYKPNRGTFYMAWPSHMTGGMSAYRKFLTDKQIRVIEKGGE